MSLLVLLLVLPAFAGGTAWMMQGVDPAAASQAVTRLGVEDPQPYSDLQARLTVLDLPETSPATGCVAPVRLDDWSAGVADARRSVQLLDFVGALARFAGLELDMRCLDRVASGESLVAFYLGAAEAHLLAAQAVSDRDQQVFHQSEADHLLAQAAAFGHDMTAPADLAPEAQEALNLVFRRSGHLPAGRLRVAGPGGQVYLDGRLVGAKAARVAVGTHLVQRVTDGRVRAARLVPVRAGAAVVVWADVGQVAPLSPDQAVAMLASGGPVDAILPAIFDALAFSGPALLVTQQGERIRVWGLVDGQVRLRLSDPPEGAAQPVLGCESGRDGAFDLGVVWGRGGWSGVVVGGRVGLARPLVLVLGVDLLGGASPGGTWPDLGRLLPRAGLRWRSPGGWVDLGVEGAVEQGIAVAPVQPVFRPLASGSLALPPGSRFGSRLELTASQDVFLASLQLELR